MQVRPEGRRAGVRDVARLAGVSTQTVSRVLNDFPGIRDDTRRRVLDAVEALDYRINNAARALGTSRTRTVGIIASDSALYGPAAAIAALDAAARERGLWAATAYADADDSESVRAAAHHLLSQGVDGIVAVAPHAGPLEALRQSDPNLPLAAMHGDGDRQRAAAELPVAHLASLGHQRLAELAGPSNWVEAQARSAGVAAAVEREGIALVERWTGDWSAAAGYELAEAAADRIRGRDAPTAVAVANDQMALGLIAGLTARGIRVPEDIAVVGFDDNPDAAFYTPSLTTVRIDIVGEARAAVAVVAGGDGGSEPGRIRPAELVVRRSSAAPGS